MKKPKLRVVFYARVSTDKDDQINSLESQVEYFTKKINGNPNWELIDQYVDEGITGTNVNKRKDFQRMIQDASEGKFDLILTKRVSRFARNTVDSLKYTRLLKQYGVGVYYCIENINTLDQQGEFLLTVLAAQAQEEARQTSGNVKWRHEILMRDGVVFGNGNILGYDLNDGKLSINEDQAKIVKLIFQLYVDGKGCRAIQTELANRNIKSPTGKPKWRHTVIMGILTNEKYIGVLTQRKSITPDYLEKKRIRNKGEEELIVVENNHDPIIDKELFHHVQKELQRRKDMRNIKNERYSGRYVYSSKIKCGICGKNYKRITWNKHTDGTKTYAWMCMERSEHGKQKEVDGESVGCDAVAIPEPIIDEFIKLIVKSLWDNKKQIVPMIEKILEKTLENQNYLSDLDEVKKAIDKHEAKINSLIELYTDDMLSKDEFFKKKKEYDTMVEQQKELLTHFDKQSQEMSDRKVRLEQLRQFLQQHIDFNEPKVPDQIVTEFLDHIVIKDKTHYDIYLNGGFGFNVNNDKKGFVINEVGSTTTLWSSLNAMQGLKDSRLLLLKNTTQIETITVTADMMPKASIVNYRTPFSDISLNVHFVI